MRLLISFITTLCLISCSGNMDNQSIVASDSLFVLKSILSTDIQKKFYLDDTSASFQLYLDSTKKKPFVKLDSLQKIKLLAPAISMDPIWVATDQDAYFISKQEKIGDFDVIIIETSGTDYAALVLVRWIKTVMLLQAMF